MRTKENRASILIGAFVMVLGIYVAGCKGESKTQSNRRPDSYTVEGVIRAIRPAGVGGAKEPTFVILHQAMADFKAADGRVVGMMSMPMPFAVSTKLDAKSYAI